MLCPSIHYSYLHNPIFHSIFTIFCLLISITLASISAGMGADGLALLYTAYKHATLRLDQEAWLRKNCNDPEFFSHMRAHTTVCSEVEANARIGALWMAIREITADLRIAWQPWVIAGLVSVLILFPLIWSQRAIGYRNYLPRHRVCKEA